MSERYSLVRKFDDFEAFTASLHGYDVEIQQLDRGRFTATSQHVVSGAVVLSHFIATRRMEVQGNPPANLRTFGIPTEQCQHFVWRNQPSDGNTIQIYRDVTELEMVTQPFFEAIDLSIPEDTLNQQCQTLRLPKLDLIIGNAEMLTCHPKDMRILRRALFRVCQTLGHDPALINTTGMQNEIEYELPRLLLKALCSAKPNKQPSRPLKKQLALRKAVDYIKANTNSPITLNALCQVTQVSARTLQHAFLEHFGLSPKAYLRVQRLNDAHRELFASNPRDARVAEVAHRQGFWHMGQFASDYKRLFAELPSMTLRKN
jgi:AraC family ethanolamine operon transcriptional activator